MTHDLPGEAFALLAALTWACAMVLFRYSGQRVAPLALNLFKNVVAIILLAVTLLAAPLFGVLVGDQGLDRVLALPPKGFWILAASGIIGIALADTLFFYSLNIVGVGIVSIVDCLYAPFVLLFSWVLLREQLTAIHFLGAALILGAILVASGHRLPPNTTRGQLVIGIFLGALAMAAMAFGIVIAKPVLEGFPLIWAATIRLVAGTVALTAMAFLVPSRKTLWSVFRPAVAWRTAVPGALLGTYLAYVFWIGGYKYAGASVNAILNQTTIIFAIVLATLILKEPMTRRKALGVGLALVGVLVVLYEHVANILPRLS
jgi:drug/metabolite transporter (DMT)-like permease